jgi:hypothetical protein
MTRRRRAGGILLAVTGLLLAASGLMTTGRAQEAIVAADTEARIITFDIKSAGLAVPAGVARATVAAAEGTATAMFVDYALIATLLGAIDPANFVPVPLPVDFSFPSPLKASSSGTRDGERNARVPLAGTLPGIAGGPVRIASGHEEVHATPDPSGQALVTLGGITVEGITRNAGARSESSATTEAAVATVTYQAIDIAGTVRLEGLVWRAEQLRDGTATASFGVQRVAVGDQVLPAETDDQRAAAFSAANDALAPLGIRLDDPARAAGAEGAQVGPLVIALTKSELRRATIGEAYAALSPALIQAFNAIQAQFPEAGYLLFGANIVLATLAGLGDFEVQLGGARASLGERAAGDSDGVVDAPLLESPLPAPAYDDSGGVLGGVDLPPVPLPGPAPITGFDGAASPAAPISGPGNFAAGPLSSEDAPDWWLALLCAMAVGGLALVIAGDTREEEENTG